LGRTSQRVHAYAADQATEANETKNATVTGASELMLQALVVGEVSVPSGALWLQRQCAAA